MPKPVLLSSLFGELTNNVQARIDAASELQKRIFDKVIYRTYLDWDVPTIGLDFEEIVGKYNLTVAAATIGERSKEPILGSYGLETVKERVLNHAITLPMSMQDYRKILMLLDSKRISDEQRKRQLIDLMWGGVERVVNGVEAKIDMIFIGALMNCGKFQFDENNNPEGGVRGEIDFNQPAGNIFESNTPWTEANLEKLRKGIKALEKEADEADTATNKLVKAFKDLFDPDAEDTLTAKILAVTGALDEAMQAANALGGMLGDLGDSLDIGMFKGMADGVSEVANVASKTMQGAQAGAAFGPYGAAAGAALGFVSSIGGMFAGLHDKKHERKIRQLQEQIEVLEKNYGKLADAIEDAFSKDASKLIGQQNELLRQQKALINQQIREEEQKKKSDSDRIKEWKEQIEDINKAIRENEEAAKDAVFGADIKNQIEAFASAMAEAWNSSSDHAKSAKEAVRGYMKQMVTESIKGAMSSSGAMQAIRDKLEEFYADNVLTGWEQDYIYSMAETLQKDIDSRYGWAQSLFKDSATEQSATGGYTTQLSEDTGTEISGRLTACLDSLYGMTALVTDQNSTLNNILWQHVQTNDHLTDISSYQKRLAEAVTKYLPDMKKRLDSL